MRELIAILKSNSLKQNIVWFGNIILLCIILPYYILKAFRTDSE